jgi:4-hydroxy-2-oxoglutarate aldolase
MRPKGVLAPLTTPFERDRVSTALLRGNIEIYEAAGLDGYLLFGSSGEAPLLEEPEKLRLLEAARGAVPPGKPLVVGTGLESTAATIRLGRLAADAGADLLLVLTPHYFKPRLDAAALEEHFRRVADAAPVPLLLYSVPKFTGLELSEESVIALSKHERIVGIKDSGADVERLGRLRAAAPAGFTLICGSHRAVREAAAGYAEAAILAAADVFPAEYRELFRLAATGESDAARRLDERLAPRSDLVVSRWGVAGIKAAMDVRGLHGGAPRPPLLPLKEEERRELEDRLRSLDGADAESSASSPTGGASRRG